MKSFLFILLLLVVFCLPGISQKIISVHDTTIHIRDTVFYDTTKEYVYVHDTTYIHDTTNQLVYIHDTTTLNVYVHDTAYRHDTLTLTKILRDTTLRTLFPFWFTPTLNELSADSFLVVGKDTIRFRSIMPKNYLYSNVIVLAGNTLVQLPTLDKYRPSKEISNNIGFSPADTGRGISFIQDNFYKPNTEINQKLSDLLNTVFKSVDSTKYRYDKESGLFKRISSNGGNVGFNTIQTLEYRTPITNCK